jgi:ApeA N-terminal domain 1
MLKNISNLFLLSISKLINHWQKSSSAINSSILRQNYEIRTMQMDELNLSKKAGIFKIATDKEIYGEQEIYGELTFAGRDTSLYVRDDNLFFLNTFNRYIQGTLYDSPKSLTLVNCFSSGQTSLFRYANIFPDFIISGDYHIDPDENIITQIEFTIDDANTLFYDYSAFGRFDEHPLAEEIIEKIVHAKDNQIGLKGNIPIGSRPSILYFTGKREIFTANTILGKVSASHRPVCSSNSPDGVQIKNTIFVSIVFTQEVNFGECVVHTLTLLKYLGILVGRPQNLLSHTIGIRSEGEKQPIFFDVYWSRPPRRRSFENGRIPHWAGILLDAVREPQVFSQVLENWLVRDQSWQDARQRFFDSFSQQESYPIDRLIGAANMFDILPSLAVPSDVELTQELQSAKEDCKKIFKKLPRSLERDSVLNSLGRVGKSSLKHKIRHRAKFLIDVAGDKFPDLFTVTDEAVNCRNHYVHGNNEPRFDYSKRHWVIIFFTDTLEFIFATSDLIEAGWDFKDWIHGSKTMSHPFANYCTRYDVNLQELQHLLGNSNFLRDE